MKTSLQKSLAVFIATIFIFLFVYTASSKILDFRSFRITLGRSPLIGRNAAWIALALPAIELVVSIFLLIPKTRSLGLWLSFALMALFTGYIGYMLLFESKLPCSCGGVLQQLTWKQHLWLNIALMILAGYGILLMLRKQRHHAIA